MRLSMAENKDKSMWDSFKEYVNLPSKNSIVGSVDGLKNAAKSASDFVFGTHPGLLVPAGGLDKGIDIAASNRKSKEFGGDFYKTGGNPDTPTKTVSATDQVKAGNAGATPTIQDPNGTKKVNKDAQASGDTIEKINGGGTGNRGGANPSNTPRYNQNTNYNNSNKRNIDTKPKSNESNLYNGNDITNNNPSKSAWYDDMKQEEDNYFKRLDEYAKDKGIDAEGLKDVVHNRLVAKYEDQARATAEDDIQSKENEETLYNTPQPVKEDVVEDKTNYNTLVQQGMQENTPTKYYTYDELANKNPDYIWNADTQTYSIKVVKDASAGYASRELLGNFKSYKKANSGTGMDENFGISKSSLSTGFSLISSEYGNIVPQGVEEINALLAEANTASRGGNYAAANEAYTQLKMKVGVISKSILDFYSQQYGDVSLAPNYGTLKSLAEGGDRVMKYYQMSYDDIANEISSRKPNIQVGYKDLTSGVTADEKKALLKQNPLYVQLLKTYGPTMGPLALQLENDYVGSQGMTKTENLFLSKLNTNVFKPLEESYKAYKKKTSKADADRAFPQYEQMKDLVQIMYKTNSDKYLDSMTKFMASSFIKPSYGGGNSYQGSYGTRGFNEYQAASGDTRQSDVSGTVGLPQRNYTGTA